MVLRVNLSFFTRVLCLAACFAVNDSLSSFSTITWTNLYPDTNTSSTLARREGAMITSGPIPGSVLVFGGCSSSCCYAPLNDLWLWVTAVPSSSSPSSSTLSSSSSSIPATAPSSAWYNLTGLQESSGPTGRLFHSGTIGLTPNLIYMYGGADELVGARSDFWSLELTMNNSTGTVTNLVWTQINPTAPPGSRAAHSQVRITDDGSFLLFGGENETDTLSDLWLYNSTTTQWTLLNDGLNSVGPGGRSLTALTVINDPVTLKQYLILVGGTDYLGNDHADVWAYDFETNTWISMGNENGGGNANNPWPLERHGHAVWSSSKSTATKRTDSDSSSPLFYIFGGQHGGAETDPFVGDVWSFTMNNTTIGNGNNGTFTQIQDSIYHPNPNQPVARGIGGIAVYPYNGTNILYFGGFSGYDGGLADLLHNDVWLFSSL